MTLLSGATRPIDNKYMYQVDTTRVSVKRDLYVDGLERRGSAVKMGDKSSQVC